MKDLKESTKQRFVASDFTYPEPAPAGAPATSGAEMDALATIAGITLSIIPGPLAAHEEHPADTAAAIRAHLP